MSLDWGGDKMIMVGICDDNIETAEELAQNVKEIACGNQVSVEIEVFGDGRDLADYVEHGSHFDLILLDIEMKYVNGLEAAKRIRKVDKNALLIYVTNYAGYSIEAYSVRPYQFLLKPVAEDKLRKYVSEALAEILNNDLYFRYSANKENNKILVKEIVYFESSGRSIFIHTVKGEELKFNGKLLNVENTFKDSKAEFWRIHQSYLVNRKNMYKIGYAKIELCNGEVLPISEDKRKMIREKYLGNMGACSIE